MAGILLQHALTMHDMERFPAPGVLVTVKGATVHIYAQGQGPSLVLLSGWSTACPSIDFEPLMNELKPYYRVITIEKPGYGYSSDTQKQRSLSVIVDELRTALSEACEKGPFILCGHSMAGCEVVYWASRHPEEVCGVVMLDAPAPLCYQTLPSPPAVIWSLFALSRIVGLRRLFLHFPFFVRRLHSHQNDYQYMPSCLLAADRAMHSCRYMSQPMIREMRQLKNNCKEAGGSIPCEIKLLMFIASDTKKRWAMLLPEEESFIARNHALAVELNGKHYLQHYAPKEISFHIRQYFCREASS